MISYSELLRIHMPPYYDSIVKGVSTVMVSYSSWNGQKMHANHFLVTNYLKNKLKFRVINKTYLITSLIKQLKCSFGSLNLYYVRFWFSKFWFFGQLSLFLESKEWSSIKLKMIKHSACDVPFLASFRVLSYQIG